MAPVLRSFIAIKLIAILVVSIASVMLRMLEGAALSAAAKKPPEGGFLLKQRDAATHLYLGMMTVSITWITPLSATMSVLVTLALSTITPPVVLTVSSLP